MYKLVVIDLDGTLLNDDKQIDKENRIAVAALFQRHIKVVFASDRSLSGLCAITDKFDTCGFLDYSVCYDGAYIIDHKNNHVLGNHYLNGDDFSALRELVTTDDLSIYAFNGEKIIVTEMNPYAYEEAFKNNTSIVTLSLEAIMNEMVVYKIVIAGNREKLDEIEKSIPMDLKNNYNLVRLHENKLAFLNPYVNKGQALKSIADSAGLLLEETMAMGDGLEDMTMIQSAGKGIAMSNAPHDLKSKADYVTDSNNCSGVAKALEKFILAEEVEKDTCGKVPVM